MNYYIGADLGTSSLKFMLVSVEGEIVASVTKEYSVSYPENSWSEQDPANWRKAFRQGIAELTKAFNKEDIKAIGVAGQMHGLVILDENDKVIRPVILWNDSRTEKETAYLNDVIGKTNLSEYTGNIAFAGFTAPKILWLKENEPENYGKISKIMLPKDYINYLLTGIHSCDYSDASGMLLLDVKNKCFSKEMLKICGVYEKQMPRLFESYEVVGKIKEGIADTTNKEIHYFSCGNYVKDTRGNCPKRHYIRSDALEQIVLLELKHLANFLKYDEERLAEILEFKCLPVT